MDGSGNQLVWMISAGIGIMTFLALILVTFFLFSRRKILQSKIKEQELNISHQKALNKQSLITQEKERRRIAKDLHDDVGSKLNVSLLYLHQLQQKIEDSPKGLEIADNTKQLINGIIQTTRGISHDLLPPTLESLGTWTAIQDLADEINRAENITIYTQFEIDDLEEPAKEAGIHLFRAIQELIKNSLSHGKANEIKIQLKNRAGQLAIEYSDNGIGFDSEKMQSGGLGLANIETRLAVLELSIRYESMPGHGVKAYIGASK